MKYLGRIHQIVGGAVARAGTIIKVSRSCWPELAKRLSGNRVEAFQTFATLAEGLALLHGDGLLHRALTPRALCGHAGASLSIRLDRFELSTLMAAWLRGGVADNREGASWLASLPAEELVHIAPERLGPLFGSPLQHLESFSADVFSLGLMAAGWSAGASTAETAAAVIKGGWYSRASTPRLSGSRTAAGQKQAGGLTG